MDEDDDFFDTLSLTSGASLSRKKFQNHNYFSVSSNSLYHSVADFDMELDNLDSSGTTTANHVNQVSRDPKTITYSQWRDRKWRHFSNKELSVDFVLAYDEASSRSSNITKRDTFEKRLEAVGLELEKEENQRIHFVKIHVPKDVLCQYCEILKLRLPIKEDAGVDLKENLVKATVSKILDHCKVKVDPQKFPPKKYRLTAEFSRDKSYLFDIDSEDFFTTSVRITVISYILEREQYGDDEQDKGIKRLLADGVYKAAYPLHDGDLQQEGSKRKLLLDEWASVSKCIKFQPIDDIKDYFGVKFALYFTWLGFYTHMLIPASIVGLLCIFYAWTTASSDTISYDICTLNVTMCPRCDKHCDYWNLSESCTYSKIAHYIDNPATIFFAVFMSFWATLYLELWKRYSAEIAHRWGLTGFDLLAEPPRPEYLARLSNAKKRKLNVITLLSEPAVPFWRVKLPSLILSFTVAALWALVALTVVFGVVLYRMSLLTSNTLYADKSSYRIYVVPITAGLINLLCILILNYVYDKLAVWLTELELQRTQTEYDESLALKNYIFQFVNYYSSIFYIAFLKGKFVGYPSKYNRIFGFRQEECNPGGCLMELTIQLAIIMIGNQAINGTMEMVIPFLVKMYNTLKVTTGIEKAMKTEEVVISCNQWTEDYKLAEIEPRTLYSEYLEMVLQYGFVTIFVTAFPLAPLFALINNVLEMRLDAKKFIKYYRRPVPARVKDIGIWYPIMAIVGRISVVSNAFIIAFSSHFIPRLVYMLKVNEEHTDEGFIDFSLSYFNTADFSNATAPENSAYNISVCRYEEFRNPPDHELKYKRPTIYWHIMAARLAFIVVYQNLVGFVINVVQWTIPDIPRKLNDRIKREAYRVNEAIIKHETERIKQRPSLKRANKNRESVLSGDTVYLDVLNNGDLTPDDSSTLVNRRNTVYHDSKDQ